MSEAVLSVVVIGRNEGARLERCLRSVNAMQRDGFGLELIYVDSGSNDGSVAFAEQQGARVIALRPERPTAALGRNAGWRAARGEFVLFLDGDTVLHPAFVATALSNFADASIACVWGHRREMHPKQSVYMRACDLDWIYAPGWSEFCGGDALFRRDVLEQVGGFDERLIAGEEPEMCRRILQYGHRILHVDLPMTQHDLAITTFAQYWRRAVRAGHAYAEVSQRRLSGDRFWSGEVRRNQTRAMGLLLLPLTAVVLSVVLVSVWPVAAAIALLFALCLRSSWKARWKSNDAWTLWLYGVHSQLQQIPIFWGQMLFRWKHRRGQSLGLVEYKRS